MLKLVAALIVSVGLLLLDRQVGFGEQLEKVPGAVAALKARWAPAPAVAAVRGQKHFDTFCACDAY